MVKIISKRALLASYKQKRINQSFELQLNILGNIPDVSLALFRIALHISIEKYNFTTKRIH